MKISGLVLIAAFGALSLAACDKKETPAKTQQDVAAAQTEGAKNVAEETNDVILAKAKAAYKVAVEQCESQVGGARDACKSAAQATLDSEQARVDARKP